MPKDSPETNVESELLDNRWDIMEVENQDPNATDATSDDSNFTDLPNALIVTNVADSVFENEDSKVR